MKPTETPTLSYRGPADLLAAVSYLLGFDPKESLVVIGLADTTVIEEPNQRLQDRPQVTRTARPLAQVT
jgi:hypothetical protein